MSKLNGAVRRVIQAAAGGVATAATLTVSGAGGVASAAPPPATPSIAGDNISPLMNVERCGGPIQVSLDSVPGRTDLLGVSFTPTGAFGGASRSARPR